MDWFKIGKEYVKTIYCHPAYLTYMQSISYKILGWMNHKLESRFPGENQQPQIRRWYHSNGREWRGTKETFDGKRGKWKSWLKTQHSKTKIMASGSITSWQIDGEKVETRTDFIFLGSKIAADGNCSQEIRRCLLLGRKAVTARQHIKKQRYHFAVSSQGYGFFLKQLNSNCPKGR